MQIVSLGRIEVSKSISIVHGTTKFLHDLDILEIDDIEFRWTDYGENGINGERSKEIGVLTNNLVVET